MPRGDADVLVEESQRLKSWCRAVAVNLEGAPTVLLNLSKKERLGVTSMQVEPSWRPDAQRGRLTVLDTAVGLALTYFQTVTL